MEGINPCGVMKKREVQSEIDVTTILKGSLIEVKQGTWEDATEELLLWTANSVATAESSAVRPFTDEILLAHPVCNMYIHRHRKVWAGEVEYSEGSSLGPGRKAAFLVCQVYPGDSKYPSDSEDKRIEWFKECVARLRECPYKSIGFQEFLGCPSSHPGSIQKVRFFGSKPPSKNAKPSLEDDSGWKLRLEALKELSMVSDKKIVMYRKRLPSGPVDRPTKKRKNPFSAPSSSKPKLFS